MIYKEVLFVDKVHYAHEEHPNAGRHYYDRGYRKPQLSLLKVCKQVHAEAEPLYLSMNVFELPDNFTEYEPFRHFPGGTLKHLDEERPYIFLHAVFSHVKNLGIVFTRD
jgi:hypothetical protein